MVDPGGDLRKEGITFEVDGRFVHEDRISYDPTNGYFAVDGPFDLHPGRHRVRLTATDDQGNRAERSLSFIPGERVTVSAPGKGDLEIEEITLWEIRDHNGDGKAGPGERVRLFVTLRNNGNRPLKGVVGRLVSEEGLVIVETERVAYGAVDPADAPPPVHGFEIHIDRNILETTSSEPFHAAFTLVVTSEKGERALPFTLPIYKHTLPVAAPAPSSSLVKVTIDPLPQTTDAEEILVSGTAESTASAIEKVMAYVNGTAFEAVWHGGAERFAVTVPLKEGDNVIEVQATDQSGALGSNTAFINRTILYVPPELEITNPPDFFNFGCEGVIYLEGTFSTGSSSIQLMEAELEGDEGFWAAIPLNLSDGTFRSQDLMPLILEGMAEGNKEFGIIVRLRTTHGDQVQAGVWIESDC
jgi:hypothetical protein